MKIAPRWILGCLAAAALCTFVPIRDTRACGGFFVRRSAATTATLPSLQVEQVLILHDPEKEEEHLIREIVFRDTKEPFGFVVPTPSQPTVAKVDKAPFGALAARFPPEPARALARGTEGPGGLGGGAAPPVTVLTQERIGSFTAFVLAATDAAAMKKWLDDNDLVTTQASEAWLAHYVDLGFTFVAFRYEPDAKSAKRASRSETVRISFATPVPYYPYREPDPVVAPDAGAAGLVGPRILSVWLVSPERSVPVARVKDGEAQAWKRPWKEARTHAPIARASLAPPLGPLGALLPGVAEDAGAAPLVVQTFQDQKTSRHGWGDVVLVPETPHAIDAPKMKRLDKLMASLDDHLRIPR